jgi:hypothetical protein
LLLNFSDDDGADQISRDGEEDVDSDEAAAKPGRAGVEAQHG